MLYRHDDALCFEDRAGPDGLNPRRVEALLERLAPAFHELKRHGDAAAAALTATASRADDLDAIEALAERIRKRFAHVVVAGAGGSVLSGHALAKLRASGGGPKLHFLETIDPEAIAALLAECDMKSAFVIAISKSGATAETLAQFFLLLAAAEAAVGATAVAERFAVITDPADNPLKAAAAARGIAALEYDPAVGGRFSILTNVGLLPAAIAGLDIRALRRGAQTVVAALDAAPDPAACPPALGAALQYAFIEKGRNLSVMFAYSERLTGFTRWYRQCWSESLGKNGKGSTPLRGIGTTDQHSQLQLYLDGPKDKLFHLILLKRAGTGQAFAVPDKKELAYLQGKTTGDIMAAEQKATLETLARNRCPARVFELDALKEEQMGALLMHFMLEIVFMSRLLEVNPFDQPAVEESKRLARDYLLTGNL